MPNLQNKIKIIWFNNNQHTGNILYATTGDIMQSGNVSNQIDGKILSKKSWTAYVVPVFILSIISLVIISVIPILFFLPISYTVYRILYLKSIVLYSDSDGVWVYRGVFPWDKGIVGVKWKDLNEAVYLTNFFSWSFKSYTIHISHRFTKSGEIILDHMYMGNIAVETINTDHINLYSQ